MIKKILLLFLLLILSCPCYANNSKQKEDEDYIRTIINSPSARLSKHQLSLKQDYELFKKGNKQALYSQIEALELKYKNADDKISKINYKYVEELKNLYLFVIETPYTNSFSIDFYNNFEKRKLIIPDKDYEKLDESLKDIIPLVNVYY